MISITSDSPRARAQFVRAFASPDGTTEFVSDGHVLLPFFPPPPPGVPAPDDLTKVSGPFLSLGSPYVSLRVLVLEHDEFGIPGPPVLGATVDVSIWCVFGPGGASFPPAPGGPPR